MPDVNNFDMLYSYASAELCYLCNRPNYCTIAAYWCNTNKIANTPCTKI